MKFFLMYSKLSSCLLFLLCFSFSCGNNDGGTPETNIVLPDDGSPEDDVPNVIWKNWYLSVPIDRGDGGATSIFHETIEAGALTEEEASYFYQNSDGTYTMKAKFTGFTTSGEYAIDGGKYCRTELREFWQGDQDVWDNWSMGAGTHILESTLEVTYCEGGGRTIVAQIHAKETEGLVGAPATVKIRWNEGDIVVDYYTKPDEGEPWTSAFDEKITVGKVDNEIFTIKLKIEGGKLYYGLFCEAKGIDTDYMLVFDYVGNGYKHENYFKTGNYFVWNEGYEEEAEVILHKVVTKHD